MAHFAAMATPAPEMAAPTIQEVLANPLVARTIDTMNELIPGVPATKQNLQTLFDETQDHHIFMGFGIQPGMGVRIYKNKKLFTVEVIAPKETYQEGTIDTRHAPTSHRRTFQTRQTACSKLYFGPRTFSSNTARMVLAPIAYSTEMICNPRGRK